jgi:uncharacterized integral membrane protein (TIGR00698 family)
LSAVAPAARVPALETLAPGVGLSVVVAAAAWLMAWGEERVFGHPVVEALVLAIVIGMIIRTVWAPTGAAAARIEPGIGFTAKPVLEVAVCLLGVSVDLQQLLQKGPALAVGIVLLVVLGLAASYLLGRALGLPHKLAVLVACGNSICGNSAIAAVAPVIDADSEHIASAIAFTAILGVVVVVTLPFLVHPLGLSFYQYGVLAGLTVYAVPQVLAAAFSVSALSGQVGTVVKLVRVLMLGPVVLFFALQRRVAEHRADRQGGRATASFSVAGLVPWFILGFLVLAALRSSGLIPAAAVKPTWKLSGWLTIAAMAALGLSVDLSALKTVGRSVALTVTGSLLVLIVLALGLIHGLKIQ